MNPKENWGSQMTKPITSRRYSGGPPLFFLIKTSRALPLFWIFHIYCPGEISVKAALSLAFRQFLLRVDPSRLYLRCFFNKSLFTEKPIRQELEPWHIDWADSIDFIAKSFLPSLTPGFKARGSPLRGGYSFDKAISALSKRPDYAGRVRSISRTAADIVFGLKTFPVNANEKLFYDTLQSNTAIRKAVFKAGRIQGHPGISDEEKSRTRSRTQKNIERELLRFKNTNFTRPR